jgi:hypothetical protein
MDDQTLIASLKNDLSKLEKEIASQHEFIYNNADTVQNLNLQFESYRTEQEKKYKALKSGFIELLDTYFSLKRKVIDLNRKDIKNEEYIWYEKSGLL